MIGSVGRALRGAQAAFPLDGTLLEDDHGVLRPTPRAEATFRAPAPPSPLTTFNPHRPAAPGRSRLAVTEARNRCHLPAQTSVIQARTNNNRVERQSNDSAWSTHQRAAQRRSQVWLADPAAL